MYKNLLLSAFLIPTVLFGQNSFTLVNNTLSTKCSNGTCHSSMAMSALKFDGGEAATYAAIVDQLPSTAASVSRNEKLVFKNQPYDSYLLKRAGGWLDTDLSLPAGEVDAAHITASQSLSNVEVEYIRQWIMNGARKNGNYVDTSAVNRFYADTSSRFSAKPAKPAAGAGTQVRLGPLFVPANTPNSEIEFLLKHQLTLSADAEVTEVDGNMNPQSHHFLLFKFDDSTAAAALGDGLRIVKLGGQTTSSFEGSKSLTGAWQTSAETHLPAKTAFFWDKKTYLDLNYHVKNYNTTGVEAFDFYLNVVYKPKPANTTTYEMKTQLINNIGFTLNPNSVTTVPYSDPTNGRNEMRYLWWMSSHTHKFGTGFNIYKQDNTKPNKIGDTLYKGTYNYDQGFDNGVYDWEHPTIRFFQPQLPIDMKKGIICETTWNNTSNQLVHFSFQTSGEMQLYYYMYTLVDPNNPTAGVEAINQDQFQFNVYPNPMSEVGTISYQLSQAANVVASITDIAGKEVATLKDEKQAAGVYAISIADNQSLAKGIYFARLSVDGNVITRKFVIN